MHNKSVAIIGAGLSAAVCAKSLNGLVKNITVFEQSDFIGGRLRLSDKLSTTPSFTVSTPFFQQIIDRWVLEGIVNETTPWHVEISASETNSLNNDQTEYTVKQTMTALVDGLLKGLNVRLNTEVTDVEKSGGQWRLFDFEGGYLGKFDSIIFSSTSVSVLNLVKSSEVLHAQIKNINHSSVWSVEITLNDRVNLVFDHATFINSNLSSCFKANKQTIVLMANPEWSEKFSALPRDQVATQLSEEFCQLLELDKDDMMSTKARFWPTKAPINTVGEDCIFDELTGFGACGDWCTSPRVEGAVLSGFSIADRVMKYFS